MLSIWPISKQAGVPINLVPYLAGTLPISKAANITTNFLGTSYLLAVLRGLLANSYFGTFFMLCAGGTSVMLGLGLLVLSTALSKLQPAPCGPTGPCKPAGDRYMAPLYAALYTIAFGTGLVKPNTASLREDQFDDSSPKERKQSVHFFVWFYFFINIGLLIAFTLGVGLWLLPHVVRRLPSVFHHGVCPISTHTAQWEFSHSHGPSNCCFSPQVECSGSSGR